jgi:2-polyprenyl-3-methyl-5-hydroxy-6-metoxy-1,4-benzoquinol methylase
MTTQRLAEQSTLDRIAADSWYAQRVPTAMIRYCGRIFSRHFKGRRCLELGPAEGILTEFLTRSFDHVTAVEGSGKFAEALKARLPELNVVHAMFEDYRPAEPFDTIVLGHVLEHVEAPRQLLVQVASWLAPGGVICSAVPNARSIHRQAAVLLRMLPAEDAMNEADIHHGHRRIYNPESFRSEFIAAGLDLEAFGGYWLKPLSNSQLESWTPEMLDAFMALGERYPDIAAEIYVVARARA